jgi:hypothetical protein
MARLKSSREKPPMATKFWELRILVGNRGHQRETQEFHFHTHIHTLRVSLEAMLLWLRTHPWESEPNDGTAVQDWSGIGW